MNKLLITGGLGFIGTNLIQNLLKENEFNIVSVDNNFINVKPTIFQKRITTYFCDITDRKKLEYIFKKERPDIVVHLAAIHYIPYCISRPSETIMNNVIGTESVLNAAKKNNVLKVIFASSAAVYKPSDYKHKENDELKPLEIYGESKLFGEYILQRYSKETDIKSIALRLFNVYGDYETNPHLIPDLVKQIKDGKTKITLGNLEPKRDYIHVNDVVHAIQMLINFETKDEFQVYNVGTGIGTSVEKIAEYLEENCKNKLIFNSISKKKRKNDRMNLVADISKIKEELGWYPKINVKEGIAKLLESDNYFQQKNSD
ncbi:MAG: GDP-mannose 4,6-dehydratase [Candidatus Heimdallarchaeum endolithica]|uniref:GDP-mannose 4,6-dehydratase n=1 Tax=Candidatus Heimdallarchaeum endolithica TaxID=2876572 RepID=A0A9Y1FPC9_9ARCH|nr:MAG: GDP-mannose 4,6-dehydratase [Candidatus Heimdallarchaeum endolithica]